MQSMQHACYLVAGNFRWRYTSGTNYYLHVESLRYVTFSEPIILLNYIKVESYNYYGGIKANDKQ